MKWAEGLFIGLLLYLLIFQILAIWPFTVDDMYITLRYAKHWASGLGIVWNVHEAPVEGYSNFSFVLLATGALRFKMDPVLALKAAGFIGLFFTCVFIFLITRLWFARRESWLACIGVLLYQGQIIWAVAGLETTVYEALLSGCVYFSFRGLGYDFFPHTQGQLKPKAFFIAGLLLSLAGLTRPEAPVLMVLFGVLIALESKTWKAIPWFILPISVVYLPYFFWRWHYFGYLFPNPVYCKGYAPRWSGQLDRDYLQLIWPFIVFSLPACLQLCKVDSSQNSLKTLTWNFASILKMQDGRFLFLCLPSVVYLILLYNSDPIVAFHNRLFLPAFVLLFPLVLKGLSDSLILYLKNRDMYYFLCMYLSAFCFAFVFIPSLSIEQYKLYTVNPKEGDQLRKKVIQWLKRNSNVGDQVVLGDSGMIPYYSDLDFIDSYCLNNKQMAHLPPKKRDDLFCHQIFEQNPKIFILASLIENKKTIFTCSDGCLSKILKNQKTYQLSKVFTAADPFSIYRYEIFIRQN